MAKVVPIDALPAKNIRKNKKNKFIGDIEIGSLEYDDEEDKDEEEDTPRDAMGNPILFDENGKPINPIVNERTPSRMEQEIEYVMNSLEDRLSTLRFDLFYQRNRMLMTFVTVTFLLIGAFLFCFAMNLTILFYGRSDSVDVVALSFAVLCWTPAVPYFRFVCYPPKKERTQRRKLNWSRKERRKPTLFNQLVDEAQAATEPPPYKTRVIAHFRKKEYPMNCATWKDFCTFLEQKTSLPVDRQLIRYDQVELDIDLAMPLHLPPYSLPQNTHLYVYNRGGYFTKDTKVKRQYQEIVEQGKRKPPPKYEPPPDFNKDVPFSFRNSMREIIAFTPRLSSREADQDVSRTPQQQQTQQHRSSAQSSSSATRSFSEEGQRGKPPPPSINTPKPKSSANPIKPQAKTTTTIPVLPIASSGGSVASSVAYGGSTVGGSVASSKAMIGDDRSYSSMFS